MPPKACCSSSRGRPTRRPTRGSRSSGSSTPSASPLRTSAACPVRLSSGYTRCRRQEELESSTTTKTTTSTGQDQQDTVGLRTKRPGSPRRNRRAEGPTRLRPLPPRSRQPPSSATVPSRTQAAPLSLSLSHCWLSLSLSLSLLAPKLSMRDVSSEIQQKKKTQRIGRRSVLEGTVPSGARRPR